MDERLKYKLKKTKWYVSHISQYQVFGPSDQTFVNEGNEIKVTYISWRIHNDVLFTLGWFLFPFTLTESSQSSCKFYSAGKQRVREVLITYPNLRRNFKSILAWAPNTTSTSKLSWLKKNFKISRRCQKWQGLEITAAFPLYKSNNNEREKKYASNICINCFQEVLE